MALFRRLFLVNGLQASEANSTFRLNGCLAVDGMIRRAKERPPQIECCLASLSPTYVRKRDDKEVTVTTFAAVRSSSLGHAPAGLV
ncbi:hypothetical protein LX36DRAFT_660009, partial [Colletotrichum falcatum]